MTAWFQNTDEDETTKIENLINRRIIAKNQKDWTLADEIRQDLHAMGVEIEDKPGGLSVWKKR